MFAFSLRKKILQKIPGKEKVGGIQTKQKKPHPDFHQDKAILIGFNSFD